MSGKGQKASKKNAAEVSTDEDQTEDSSKPSTSKASNSSASTSNDNEICISENCNNKVVSHPEWDNEYCSVICCYNHCKNTFRAWLHLNKEAKAKAIVAMTRGQAAGPSIDQPDKAESIQP